MYRIWVGGSSACDIHTEKKMIINFIKNNGFELVSDVRKADIIILTDSCFGTYNQFLYTFQCIENILKDKKEDAKVILSGCITRGVKFELTDKQKTILDMVTIIKIEDLVPYVAEMLRGKVHPDDFDIPYFAKNFSIQINPVHGCLNHCSFCKTNYTNFDLKSYPFEKVESLTRDMDEIDYPFRQVSIQSSNLSLYGVDLYGKARAHEVIRSFTQPTRIKFAYIGALINWYQELVDEILSNSKVKEIAISLESGSPRVYKLMNRPITLENLIQIIKLIRIERPDIVIQTEFIAGFPTETIDDLKRTIDLAYELDVYPAFVWPYYDSKQIPSSKLKGHDFSYCEEAALYVIDELEPLKEKFKETINNGEMVVVNKVDAYLIYETILINGALRYIRMDQVDREYEVGEIIPANMVKPKQLVKRK